MAAQKQKSKFFRVAVEGDTIDGREIDRAYLKQMAASYDRTVYAARVWPEHIRGLSPTSDFKAMGDVIALKTEEVEIAGAKKLALFAQIEPLPELVTMVNKDRQKIFTSIEIIPNLKATGGAYLGGLGVTDTPASLGTEELMFKAGDKTLFVFTPAQQTTIEFEASEESDTSFSADGFKSSIANLVNRFKKKATNDDDKFAAVVEGLESMTEEINGHFSSISQALEAQAGVNSKAAEAFKKFDERMGAVEATLKALDTTDKHKHSQRPPASGGDGKVLTDC